MSVWRAVQLCGLILCFLVVVEPKSCGRRRSDLRSQRIVGGVRSARGEWPWQVSLHQRNPHTGQLLNQHCGGTLIDPSWVLTAAHCIVDPLFGFTIPPVFWIVKLGHIELSDQHPPRLATVSKIITHKYFDTKTWNHDIALVKLRTPLRLDLLANINTVCLPAARDNYENHLCHVTGWGKVMENGSDSELLQKIAVPVIPYNDCYKKYESINPITPGMVCAGGDEPSKGPCVGDSGGPLQCRRADGAWVQIGVTSWGVGCARQSYPSVYVKVADYITWIYFHLAKDYLAGLRLARSPKGERRETTS